MSSPACPSSNSFTVTVAMPQDGPHPTTQTSPGSAVRGEASLGVC
jgi:hypothetical protein